MDKKSTTYLTEREVEILNSFPVLTQEDIDGCNDLFTAYMVYESKRNGRRVWTSCCHREGVLLPYIEQTMTPEREDAKRARHNDKIDCPFCGKTVTVKCRGKFKSVRATNERIPVVFLHTGEDGSVYAQAYIALKDYGEYPSGYAFLSFDRAYWFRPGEGHMFKWLYGEYYAEEERGKIGSKKKITEPFLRGWYGGNLSYKVIFKERLQRSFARYCDYAAWEALDAPNEEWNDDLMRFLLAAAIYPRQLEMLVKSGQRQLINDLLWVGKKNCGIFDWTQSDPRKAFAMTKEELKLYFEDKTEIDGLQARKLLHCSYAEVREWITGRDRLFIREIKMLIQEANYYGLSPEALRKYLLRFTGPRCYGAWYGLSSALTEWRDYLVNAEAAGYDLTNRDRVLPRDLHEAHNEASEIVQRKKAEQDRKKKREMNREAKLREKTLNEKYSFETEHYIIRAPKNMQEILDEGKQLSHCVGGYAARHAAGTATILFLRDKRMPKKPLCTIEVRGNALVQIHGYRNEQEKGSIKPEIRFAEIYEPWKRWLDKGCPRNKDGTARVPKKKGEKTA